jgi:AcrR family transcriptional regulator
MIVASPDLGRPDEPRPARQRILDTASRLFYAHGVRGVGVDTVIAEAGVAKATLYKHFASKDDLVLAYLEGVDEHWRAQLRSAADAAGPDPRARLVGMFDALVAACRSDGYHGCAFINTAAESSFGTRVHERTVEHKAVVRAWVRELAVAAGARDPAGLADGLTLLLDGGLAAGVLDGGARTAASARGVARALVAAHCP